MKTLGSRIHELYGRLGVTSQSALAEALGVQRVTVNRWVKNERKPQGRYITKMARLAGVSRGEMNRYLFLGKHLPERTTVDPAVVGLLMMLFTEWHSAASFPQELDSYVHHWCSTFTENPNGIDREHITGEFRRILNNHQGDREA